MTPNPKSLRYGCARITEDDVNSPRRISATGNLIRVQTNINRRAPLKSPSTQADSRREPIAFAQSYFAVQTRKQELIEEHLELMRRLEAREKLRASEKTLSDNIFERGVDDEGFGRIRSKGDAALFGGHTTRAMKDMLAFLFLRYLSDNYEVAAKKE